LEDQVGVAHESSPERSPSKEWRCLHAFCEANELFWRPLRLAPWVKKNVTQSRQARKVDLNATTVRIFLGLLLQI